MSARTSWGFGGSGAPDGEVWVWKSCDPDVEDGRLFSATPEVAERAVRAVNAHENLLATLKAVGEFLEPQACADCACEGSNPACDMLNQIEQAIAEAEGQS